MHKALSELLTQAYEHRGAGSHEAAFTIAQECLRRYPEEPEVQCLYGILQLDTQHYYEAEKAFNTAITLNPEKADLYYFAAELLSELRRFGEAEKLFLECLKREPKHAMANFHLGLLYYIEGRFKEAICYYQKAIELYPEFQQVYYHLGIAYHKQNNLEAAISQYQKAIALNPNDVAALSNLGAALIRDRQFKAALWHLNRVLEIDPQHVAALTNLGGMYIEMNDRKNGEKIIRRTLAINPYQSSNWRNLTLCAQFDANNTEDLDSILALLNESALTNEDKGHYYFALGKIYDDMKQYDKAFGAYENANAIQASKVAYDPDSFGRQIDRIIHINENLSLKELGSELNKTVNADLGIQPLIIMGTARSGKSLLESLLTQCPEMEGVGELGIYDIANKLPLDLRPNTNYPYWLKTLTLEQAQAIRDLYLERLMRDLNTNVLKSRSSTRYLIDTMPNNFLYCGLFAFLFPGVKIIHCQRDPMDACLSMYFKYFVDGHGYSYDLTRLGHYYSQYLYLMDYWHQKLPEHMMNIHYEDLVSRPQDVLPEIMRFLSLDPAFKFDVSPLHIKEKNHWRHYEAYLEPLKQALSEPIPLLLSVDEKTQELKELMATAYLSFQQGDTISTQLICENLLTHDENHFAALHLLGLVAYQQGDLALSLQYLERALAIDASVLQLHWDIARVYQAYDQPIQAEQHFKLAELLKSNKAKSKTVLLESDQRDVLLSAFQNKVEIIDEFETRLLLQGKRDPNSKPEHYKTRSWDQYFSDLSFGRYRPVESNNHQTSPIRSWHYMYKNISLIDNVLSQTKTPIMIADIGCASGYLRRILESNKDPKSTQKMYYWGLDVRQDILENALKDVDNRESGAQGNLIPSAFIVHDVNYGLPFKDHFFDYVINYEMLKHLSLAQGKAMLSEMARILHPKGLFFLSAGFNADMLGVEILLQEAGFEILSCRGSGSEMRFLLPHITETHSPLVQDLLKVYPPEMVAAMITPLYPHAADQVTFICRLNQH